jgi:glycerophosphoryl diester phosphodiesterase
MTLRQLSDSGIKKRWLLTNFSWRRSPSRFLCALAPIKTAICCKATGIAPYFSLINKSTVQEAHNQKLTVSAWTVNEQKKIELLKNYGVDYIITDYKYLI